jgi:hypothetical protein
MQKEYLLNHNSKCGNMKVLENWNCWKILETFAEIHQ